MRSANRSCAFYERRKGAGSSTPRPSARSRSSIASSSRMASTRAAITASCPPASARELATRTDLPEKKIKVIAAQLVGAGAAERRRQKIAPLRPLRPKELDRLLSSYEKRHASDRERLEQIMHYAQSTGCRVQA